VPFHLAPRPGRRAASTWLIAALLAVAAAVSGTLVVTTSAASANQVHVTHSFFGVHDGSSSGTVSASFTHLHEGSVRLWDVGVQWRQVELTPHHYTWTRLDQLVTQAQAAHAEVTMVVAMTPSFYATDRTDPPRDLDRYREFVAALMHRYKVFHGARGITNYQVWNEANISTYWTGTTRQLARLSKIVHDVRNRLDRGARVIAPPMVTRLPYQQDSLQTFYRFRLNGTPVWRFYDALAFSMYPLPHYGGRLGVPEDSITQLHQIKGRLRRDGVPGAKPIWNTEINYGLQAGANGGTAATPISDSRQAANVARTYLLNAANGVRRVFWYRYEWGPIAGGGTFANTLLTRPTDSTKPTPAAKAYARVQTWMHGTLVGPRGRRPCQRDARGTYTCVVRDASGTRRIYWNPFRRATIRLATNAHHVHHLLGATTTVAPGSRLTVDYRPVLVTH
jgi:hypothetical protein